MKKILYTLLSVTLLFLAAACKKDETKYSATSDIFVINAAVGAGSIKVNPGSGGSFSYAKAADIAYGASNMYPGFVGNTTVTVVSSTDTTKTLAQNSLNVQPISTLYISGQSPTIDTMFRVEKNLPYIAGSVINADSSLYIRFVNLSPNSTPLKVNIKAATSNVTSNLGYRGITDFVKYSAKATSGSYTFEFRDASTNAVLSTFVVNSNTFRYRTIAIIVKGLSGTTSGPNAFSIFQVNYI